MTEKSPKNSIIITTLAFLLTLSLGSAAFYWHMSRTLTENLSSTKTTFTTELTQKSAELSNASATIAILQEELRETQEDFENLKDDYRNEKKKNDAFEDQISSITGTVKDLDKLSKTDSELLQKYSKVSFLNENYIPSDIDRIDDSYILPGKEPQFFHGDALPFLEDMLEEAADDDIDLKVISAYRSFDHQQQLKGEFTTIYGSGANTFSADQGYSEHQLGTTIDLTDPTTGGTYESFAETEAYKWLLKNAHKYGFTLSYPENNGFYIFEPWHWRFVGVDLAKDLNRKGDNFYDWDQRKIDEYLLNIFD